MSTPLVLLSSPLSVDYRSPLRRLSPPLVDIYENYSPDLAVYDQSWKGVELLSCASMINLDVPLDFEYITELKKGGALLKCLEKEGIAKSKIDLYKKDFKLLKTAQEVRNFTNQLFQRKFT